VGFGVDYARAEMLQTQMNAAADAAALAGVDPGLILEADSVAQTAATNMFNAQVSKLSGLDSFNMTPQVIDGTTNSSG
jgi:Flp pilus assembly protein TadG